MVSKVTTNPQFSVPQQHSLEQKKSLLEKTSSTSVKEAVQPAQKVPFLERVKMVWKGFCDWIRSIFNCFKKENAQSKILSGSQSQTSKKLESKVEPKTIEVAPVVSSYVSKKKTVVPTSSKNRIILPLDTKRPKSKAPEAPQRVDSKVSEEPSDTPRKISPEATAFVNRLILSTMYSPFAFLVPRDANLSDIEEPVVKPSSSGDQLISPVTPLSPERLPGSSENAESSNEDSIVAQANRDSLCISPFKEEDAATDLSAESTTISQTEIDGMLQLIASASTPAYKALEAIAFLRLRQMQNPTAAQTAASVNDLAVPSNLSALNGQVAANKNANGTTIEGMGLTIEEWNEAFSQALPSYSPQSLSDNSALANPGRISPVVHHQSESSNSSDENAAENRRVLEDRSVVTDQSIIHHQTVSSKSSAESSSEEEEGDLLTDDTSPLEIGKPKRNASVNGNTVSLMPKSQNPDSKRDSQVGIPSHSHKKSHTRSKTFDPNAVDFKALIDRSDKAQSKGSTGSLSPVSSVTFVIPERTSQDSNASSVDSKPSLASRVALYEPVVQNGQNAPSAPKSILKSAVAPSNLHLGLQPTVAGSITPNSNSPDAPDRHLSLNVPGARPDLDLMRKADLSSTDQQSKFATLPNMPKKQPSKQKLMNDSDRDVRPRAASLNALPKVHIRSNTLANLIESIHANRSMKTTPSTNALPRSSSDESPLNNLHSSRPLIRQGAKRDLFEDKNYGPEKGDSKDNNDASTHVVINEAVRRENLPVFQKLDQPIACSLSSANPSKAVEYSIAATVTQLLSSKVISKEEAQVGKVKDMRVIPEIITHSDGSLIFTFPPVAEHRFYAGRLSAALTQANIKNSYGEITELQEQTSQYGKPLTVKLDPKDYIGVVIIEKPKDYLMFLEQICRFSEDQIEAFAKQFWTKLRYTAGCNKDAARHLMNDFLRIYPNNELFKSLKWRD